ncbi:hypothetical protein LTR37_013917 [Vermiconidia calcicola]|uniref:Uncharacterized protein n=1 Tax=Vermiconidia calcicola TaxID=1690605 RepID=A0ACC3MWR8_9PEZI|nr:hypothetical protein LTR37_013917 [Vermiconidia calcicola]
MAVERAAKRRRLSPAGENGATVPGFAKWNLEQDYEQRPRKNKKKEKDRLPVRKEAGWVEQQADGREEAEVSEDDYEEDEKADSGIADIAAKPAPKKPKLPPREEIRQAKEELARIAGLISEDPEEHSGSLGSLAQFADSDNATVKKLALVYKDIIPGYRIRPLAKADLEAKLSKDVRKLRNFEQSLLGGYKDYVQSLDRLSKKSTSDASVVSVAVACACNLLTSVPHFNCRNELIALLVRKLSTRTIDADHAKCRSALEQLFQDDEEGHASLEVVKQLTTMMKTKNYHIDETVLNTFLHLRLLSEFAHKASTDRISKSEDPNDVKKAKQKKEFRTKRERKVMKERREVAKEMKEADAAVSYEERDKNQAETLKLVFIAYFRILKARTEHLMGAVLEGLAKYAHLINQDFFGDVLEALKDLINDATREDDEEEGELEEDEGEVSAKEKRNATRESLLSTITAFALLQGQQDVAKSANTLHLDLNFFITHLYRTLLPLSTDADIELSAKKTTHLADPNGLAVPSTATSTKDNKVNISTTTVLLLRALSSVLLPPNTPASRIPPSRIAAFTKQLLTLSLHLPAKSAQAVMGLLQQVAKVHGGRIGGLWNTEERRGDGVFDPLCGEIGGSNVFAGTVWEGEVLRLHFSPHVREGVKGLEGVVLERR